METKGALLSESCPELLFIAAVRRCSPARSWKPLGHLSVRLSKSQSGPCFGVYWLAGGLSFRILPGSPFPCGGGVFRRCDTDASESVGVWTQKTTDFRSTTRLSRIL